MSPHVSFQYLAAGSLYASDITASGDFTVVISKIDSVSVSGTFTGKVKDTAGHPRPSWRKIQGQDQ
jgi:hypothetical protein